MAQQVSEHSLEGKFRQASPWLLGAWQELRSKPPEVLADWQAEGFTFNVLTTRQSLWVQVVFPGGGQALLRGAYCPGEAIRLDNPEEDGDRVVFHLGSAVGRFRVEISRPVSRRALLRITTSLRPETALTLPYWPRDLLLLGQDGSPLGTEGKVHATQHASASGLQFLSLEQPRSGSLFYLQNFSALNAYFEKTKTAPTMTVGGDWPELGFALPGGENPLPADEEIVIGDALISFTRDIPQDDLQSGRMFLDLLAEIYLLLPKPQPEYHAWPERAESCLQDVRYSPKVTSLVDGNRYMAPYVGATDKPPEAMVQLAMILPMLEYGQWRGEEIDLAEELLEGLPVFYNKKLKTLTRWHPSVQFSEGEKEPQEYREVMDSWYLYHPVMNIGRLVKQGFEELREMFFNSIEFGIRVAQKFDYTWPVFYNMETLEVLRAESEPGRGGEWDVGCIYILDMMLAYDLSQDERYIAEAEKAAAKLRGLGFKLLYQTNVTSFGLSGLWRLYRKTGKNEYRELVNVLLANIFHNAWLWECDYGFGKSYKIFMGLQPLRDGLYLASYEELEVLAAFHDLLAMDDNNELPASARLLMGEFVRYALDTSWYDYPAELPREAVTEKPKTGEIDRNLVIPLEDLYEGWAQAGQVGQEAYGASGPFVYTARHYMRHQAVPFDVYCDYPTSEEEVDEAAHSFHFEIRGDERAECTLRLISRTGRALPKIHVSCAGEEQVGRMTDQGHVLFRLRANQDVDIQWEPQGEQFQSV